MVPKKISVVVLSATLLLGAVEGSLQAAVSPPGQYVPPTSGGGTTGGSQSFDDILDTINGKLDGVEEFFRDNNYGSIVKTVGGFFSDLFGSSGVSDFIEDVSGFASLVVRLINFPSQAGGWWDDLLSSVSGELANCTRSPDWPPGTTPPFVYEPGWCFGIGTFPDTGSDGGSDTGSDDGSDNGTDDGSDDGSDGGFDNGTDDGSGNPTNPGGGTVAQRKSKSIGDILEAAKGAAGIPIPSKVRALAGQAVDEDGDNDTFEIDPTIKKHYLWNRMDRASSRLAAESVLGDLGQEKLEREREGLEKTVVSSFKAASKAQSLNVTQDVMKQMTEIQAQSNLLLGSLASSSQQQRIDNALSHLNTSNMSRTLDQMSRDRRVDRTTAAQKVLRTTSQLSLY